MDHLPKIDRNVSLAEHSTMRLGGPAAYLCTVHTNEELQAAAVWAEDQGLPILTIGTGSNVVFGEKGFSGMVIVNRITGFRQIAEDDESATLQIGAGEDWDEVVARSVTMGLSGIEGLSLIPGTAGATPVQNVGAYGQEIGQTLVSIEAWDMQARQFVTLAKDQLGLGYRTSNLKVPPEQRRYIISHMTLKLSKFETLSRPLYDSLEAYFVEHNITDVSPQTVRAAVIAIRSARLPDPKHIPNTGSFFANPIVDEATFRKLIVDHPDVKAWPVPNGHKIAAGWLIEAAGLRGYEAHGMRTHEQQSLVLINDHAEHAQDLMDFRDELIAKVKSKFGITLVQEPELIGE